MKMPLNVGVTGATGKVGRLLVNELLRRGYRIRAMVRPTRNGFWGNTTPAVDELKQFGAEVSYADFSDDVSLTRFAKDLDVLIHNGYHHTDEDKNPVEWTNLNILATVKLYDAFWRAGGRQIIFISSRNVYGRGPAYEERRLGKLALPIDEYTLCAPQGLYAVYKSCIEHTTVTFKRVHHLEPSTTLRPGSGAFSRICGFRRYDADGWLYNEIKQLVGGMPVTIKLPAEISAIDGRDIASGCDLLIQKGLIEKVEVGDWYNCGNSPISADEFKAVFHEIFGELKLNISTCIPERIVSDKEIVKLGYRPRGSAATLRDHFVEIEKKLGARSL